MAGGAKVFGTVVTLESDSTCITFVAVIVLLLALEHFIHRIEEVAKHNGYDGIFNKVNKEMMILGLVSFATFVVFEATNVSTDSKWYYAFHFAHFVMLFIALAFVIQALLLTKFISIQRRRLYRLFYLSESKLVSKYNYMMSYANQTVTAKRRYLWWMYTLFFEAPYSFPFPALRDAMEYKIIEEHFVRTFLLPDQFHFAEYVSTRFQSHVFELVDVQPSSWGVLVLLLLVNYGRIQLVDPLFQDATCDEYSHDDHHDDAAGSTGTHRSLLLDHLHRVLATASPSPGCNQYMLRVAFIYCILLSLFIFLVYQVSNFYYRRHLQHAILAVVEPVQFRCEQHVPFHPELDDDADYRRTGHYFRSCYKTCLQNISAIKNHERSINTVRVLKRMRELEHTVKREMAEKEAHAAAIAAVTARLHSGVGVAAVGSRSNSIGVMAEDPIVAPVSMSVSEAERAHELEQAQAQAAASSLSVDLEQGQGQKQEQEEEQEQEQEEEESKDSFAPLLRLDSEAVNDISSDDDNNIVVGRGGGNGRLQHKNSWAPPPTDWRGLHAREDSWAAATTAEPVEGRSRSNSTRPRSMSKLDSTFTQVHRIPTNPAPLLASTPETTSTQQQQQQPLRGSAGLLSKVPSFSVDQQLQSQPQSRYADHDGPIEVSRAGNISLDSGAGAGAGGSARNHSLIKQLSCDCSELERFDNSMSRGQSLHAFYAHVSRHLSRSKSKHHHGKGPHMRGPVLSPGNHRHQSELVMDGGGVVEGSGGHGHGHGHGHRHGSHGGDASQQQHVELSELKLENDTSHIFLWRSQWVYRFSVEISLLLQCFYMALWATNLIVVATGATYYPVYWAIGMTVPMVLNFWMLRSVLFLSCTLEAVSVLDLKDSGAVCERIIQKEETEEAFRSDVRRKLLEMPGLDASDRRKFIREQLRELDYIEENDEDDDSEDSTEYRISYEQFGVFLDELGVERTDAEFDLLCHVLDDHKTHISGEAGGGNSGKGSKGKGRSKSALSLLFEDSISLLHIYSVLFPEVHFLLRTHNSHNVHNAREHIARVSSSISSPVAPSAPVVEESLDLYDDSTTNEQQLFRRNAAEAMRRRRRRKSKSSAWSADEDDESAPWYHCAGLWYRLHHWLRPPSSLECEIEVVGEEEAGSSEYVQTWNDSGEGVFAELETVLDAETGQIVLKRMHSKANILGEGMFARRKSERRGSVSGGNKAAEVTDEADPEVASGALTGKWSWRDRIGRRARGSRSSSGPRGSMKDDIEMVVDGSVFGLVGGADDGENAGEGGNVGEEEEEVEVEEWVEGEEDEQPKEGNGTKGREPEGEELDLEAGLRPPRSTTTSAAATTTTANSRRLSSSRSRAMGSNRDFDYALSIDARAKNIDMDHLSMSNSHSNSHSESANNNVNNFKSTRSTSNSAENSKDVKS